MEEDDTKNERTDIYDSHKQLHHSHLVTHRFRVEQRKLSSLHQLLSPLSTEGLLVVEQVSIDEDADDAETDHIMVFSEVTKSDEVCIKK